MSNIEAMRLLQLKFYFTLLVLVSPICTAIASACGKHGRSLKGAKSEIDKVPIEDDFSGVNATFLNETLTVNNTLAANDSTPETHTVEDGGKRAGGRAKGGVQGGAKGVKGVKGASSTSGKEGGNMKREGKVGVDKNMHKKQAVKDDEDSTEVDDEDYDEELIGVDSDDGKSKMKTAREERDIQDEIEEVQAVANTTNATASLNLLRRRLYY